jgi:hypothetical protein
MWNEVKHGNIPEDEVLIGYSPEWVDPDFNPKGFRECFEIAGDNVWISAKWNDYHDCYETDDTTSPQLVYQIPELPMAIRPIQNYQDKTYPEIFIVHGSSIGKSIFAPCIESLKALDKLVSSNFKSEAQVRRENEISLKDFEIEVNRCYEVVKKNKQHSYSEVKKRNSFFNKRK